ncbi:MAG: hypothetical protein ABSE62_10375 [Chthoniobacteraceae bacterium]|jgi:hypothetical protein
MKALRAIGGHIVAWLEWYFWVPLALCCIHLSAILYTFLTHGRSVQEDPAWIVDQSAQLVRCVLAIALVSIFKQATGVWWTKAEMQQRPAIAVVDSAIGFLALCAFSYVLSH